MLPLFEMLPLFGCRVRLPAVFDCLRSRDASNAPENHNMPQSGVSYKKLLAYRAEGGSGFCKMNHYQEDRKTLH